MVKEIELDGCKFLNNVVWINFIERGDKKRLQKIFNQIKKQKINLLFINCIKEKDNTHVNIGLNPESVSVVLEKIKSYGIEQIVTNKAVVLSIFPHKNSPHVISKILSIYRTNGIKDTIFSNSFSAISIICSRDVLKQHIKFLIQNFHFKRPIEDWCKAQKEKQDIYKEVVASYQEKRPKVYFLEYRDSQILFQLLIDKSNNIKDLENSLINTNNISLAFFVSTPYKNSPIMSFSISSNPEFYKKVAHIHMLSQYNVVAFSMNGPHFGDRYGIISQLFDAIYESGSELLGLSCSLHSIIGVLPQIYSKQAIESICSYFEVPNLINKNL